MILAKAQGACTDKHKILKAKKQAQAGKFARLERDLSVPDHTSELLALVACSDVKVRKISNHGRRVWIR